MTIHNTTTTTWFVLSESLIADSEDDSGLLIANSEGSGGSLVDTGSLNSGSIAISMPASLSVVGWFYPRQLSR
jgi:hypothetical protein